MQTPSLPPLSKSLAVMIANFLCHQGKSLSDYFQAFLIIWK